jgi:cytochrome c
MRKGIQFVLVSVVLMALITVPAYAVRRDVIIEKCKEAAGMISSKGIKTVSKAIDDPEGPFVWNNKINYVFLMDLTGKMLAHPFKPGLKDHKTLLDYKDIKGKKFFIDFVNVAMTDSGMGWVNYMWPIPGHEKPVKKSTFIYRVQGTDYFVGSGLYVVKPGEYY